MNKKLFSWKALAGLALLVAMGLTSCKNNTEVDPNDPYATKTPTQPGISTKGAADVTITITKAGDLAEQWAKLDAKTVKELREKTTLNVAINNAGYKLEGAAIALPNFFSGADNGATGKVVNVTFNNGFQNAGYGLSLAEYAATAAGDVNADKKQYLYLNTDKLAGNQVNFYFPAQNFDLRLETTKVQTSLNSESEANIGILTAQAAEDKSALKINSGVAVKAISLPLGDVIVNGGSLAAKLADVTGDYPFIAVSGWNWAAGGFVVGNNKVIYVKSLIVDRGVTATIDNTLTAWPDGGLGNSQGTAESIIIKKNGELALYDDAAHVNSIVGENANAKLTTTGAADWTGYTTDFANIGSVTKVVNDNIAGNPILLSDNSKFTTVEFKDFVDLGITSVSGLTFNGLNISIDKDNLTYSFSDVKFKAIPSLSADYETETSATSKTWQWIVSGTSGYWSEVKSSAPLKAYNASADVQEFKAVQGLPGSSEVYPTEGSATLAGWNTGAVTSTVIKITYTTSESIWPEGTVIALNNCKYNNDKVQAAQANTLFGNVSEKTAWYDVVLDGVTLKWRLNNADKWVLVNP